MLYIKTLFLALLLLGWQAYAESDDEGDYEELRHSHSESGVSKGQDKGSTIAQESKMKKFNKSAVWTERKCDRCRGTGSVPTAIYDNKKNSVTKIMLACPKCKGRGYEGMTKE